MEQARVLLSGNYDKYLARETQRKEQLEAAQKPARPH